MALAHVQELSRAAAAAALAPIMHLEPSGQASADQVAGAGMPLQLDVEGGRLVLVLDRRGACGRQLWIEAAVGQGSADLTAAGLRFVEETGRHAGCQEVAFQTSRRGLVRRAERLGYQVHGFILRKAIT